MTEAMTDAPDIVIRRAHDRVCLAEVPERHGISLLVAQKEEIEQITDTFLVFADEETALMWTALRGKELACEGVEVYLSPLKNETLQELPDKRFSDPLYRYRSTAVGRMLDW